MLEKIKIHNFALIKEANITLSNYDAILGESGSGKSLLVKIISYIKGERADSDDIGAFDNHCSIIATLVLEDNYINQFKDYLDAGENILLIERYFDKAGKSLCKVNGATIPLKIYATTFSEYIDIQNQEDSYAILSRQPFIDIFDSIYSKNYRNLYEEYYANYLEYKKLNEELKTLSSNNIDKETYQEYLSELDEIVKLNYVTDEEVELKSKIELFRNATNSIMELKSSSEIIEDIRNSLYTLKKTLSKFPNFKIEILDDMYYSLRDYQGDITSLVDSLTNSDIGIEALYERLSSIQKYHRIYKNVTNGIIGRKLEIEKIIDEYNNSLYNREKLQQQFIIVTKNITDSANKLSLARAKYIPLFIDEIKKICSKMYLNITSRIISDKVSFSPKGIDKYFFEININAEDYLTLDSLSGGEKARILLALKLLTSNDNSTALYVFDEVDSGVSGRIASSMGELISALAKNKQVIVISHQPLVLAYAKDFLEVSKIKAVTSIKKLEDSQVLTSLSSLISSDDNSLSSISLIKELLDRRK